MTLILLAVSQSKNSISTLSAQIAERLTPCFIHRPILFQEMDFLNLGLVFAGEMAGNQMDSQKMLE